MSGYLWRGKRELAELNAAIAASAEPSDCGTPAAYRRHLRRGERACDACLKAESVTRSRRRSAQRAAARREREATITAQWRAELEHAVSRPA